MVSDRPADLPDEVLDALQPLSSEQLRVLAQHAEALAESDDDGQDDGKEGEQTAQPADRPDDVPSKASITVKEINDNRYYYWQWREGEKIRSKYKGPVDGGK